MILKVEDQDNLFFNLNKIGLKSAIDKNNSVAIKVNLARPAETGHPRTDPILLSRLIEYIGLNNGKCTIVESANGYLSKNLNHIGLGEIISNYKVDVVDLDLEETEKVIIGDEEHFIPKCLKNFGVRIGLPATSKRPGMIFSNNIKLFVGAVPRSMYQIGDKSFDYRPRVHIDLHKSVANIYRAIEQYSPFDFYINGGLAMDENKGEFMHDSILIGNDALELDLYVLNNIFVNHDIPEYIKRLQMNIY